MTSTSFRSFIPHGGHPRLGDVKFEEYDAHSWTEFGLTKQMIIDLWTGWQKLYKEPFIGITADGKVENDLFTLRDEDAPIHAMFEAAQKLKTEAERYSVEDQLRYPITADEWRCWANPEFYFVKRGLRLEEQPLSVQDAILGLIKASLSERGYSDLIACLQINGFLGDIVGAQRLMNEKSFNIILFGEPSYSEPWGWSFWGHHITLCVLVVGFQMVISPVFRGCEPNVIDAGEHSGVTLFNEEMRLATNMMALLTDEEKRQVIVYDRLDHPDMPEGFPHPADGRNLAGAYEDNRIIPYTGAVVGSFSAEAQQAVLALIEEFLHFIPEGPLKYKMDDAKTYLDRTWLMWMGGHGDQDVFHFRIHSPILICEFDHECGMYLTNDEPGRFHVHTVVRTPNGNDYGKELIRLWQEKQVA